MNKRTIMIFPEFQNMEIINNIRRQYDPLYELVQPHITLVFPFESPISNEELANVLNLRLQEIPPFELKLNGISMHADTSGNYLFLNVIQGTNELKIIHQALYDNEFKEFDKGIPYIPHMTIGNLSSVEMIGDNGESIIIIEKELNMRRI